MALSFQIPSLAFAACQDIAAFLCGLEGEELLVGIHFATHRLLAVCRALGLKLSPVKRTKDCVVASVVGIDPTALASDAVLHLCHRCLLAAWCRADTTGYPLHKKLLRQTFPEMP